MFVTAAALNREPSLGTPEPRDAFLEILQTTALEHRVELVVWVVLKEHYHLLARPEDTEAFPIWLRRLHTDTAVIWNREDGSVGRQHWYQYWDRNLWTLGDVYSRINYIHGHAVKHGYVTDPLARQWSSYDATLDDVYLGKLSSSPLH